MSFEPLLDWNNETKVGVQAEHETNTRSVGLQPAPWNEGDRLYNFLLERLLGQGSSGFVYRAVDLDNDHKTVALKLLRPDSTDDLFRNRLGFRKMMSVHHPNLVRVNRIHQLGMHVALSMEEVDGLTFDQARLQLQQLDPPAAYDQLLSMLHQFASGLAAMHTRGLVHRDIKPGNMMIRNDGVAKIIDYGLVEQFRFEAVDCKPLGFIFGTPRYMAPEVYWSQRYLPSGDIFGLGIVFLETLLSIQTKANQSPTEFSRSTVNRREDRQRIRDAIDDLSASIPVIIRETCRQMLSKNPADRPTALELWRVGRADSMPVSLPISDPFIGRKNELKQIQGWVDNIFAGAPGRLHISGPSGIGKSRIIEEVIEYIESKHWGQLFYAKCRRGEDHPLQAFDQLSDAIADRYMQSDREPLEFDPLTVSFLKSAFPVLSNVITARIDVSQPGPVSIANDASEAAVRMSQQLRRIGPLFAVVDDSQWADLDSRNLLDQIANQAGDQGIGVITVSREPDTHRIPAQQSIEIGPLEFSDSVALLLQSAQRWKLNVRKSALQRLAARTDGHPFRLRELANEFRPGGVLADGFDSADAAMLDLETIDRLWQRRADRLSDGAKRTLLFVATAGGRTSTAQLAELTGLDDSIDAAISELVQQRLITDEATGGECIQIVHDRVADEMMRSLSDQAKRGAHHAWASHLVRQESPQQYSARIAGHFFAAGEPGQAVSHAILAAEDAEERSAKYEAARLYERVAKHVSGSEKINQLRNAAQCFRQAEYPVKSAACFQALAALLDGKDQFRCQLMAVSLLIRAGRVSQVRSQLRNLARRVGLPTPKSHALATLALTARQLQLLMYGRSSLLAKLTEQAHQTDKHIAPVDDQIQQRLDFCVALIRPLSGFDLHYAAELSMVRKKLLLLHPDTQLRFNAAADEATFACCDKGRKRSAGEAQLSKLKTLVSQIGNSRSCGDVAAGIAIAHGLSGRWSEVQATVEESVSYYRESSDPCEFEIAHSLWLNLWAMWHLGQWRKLRKTSSEVYDDAVRRNDTFQQVASCSGYAAAAWLVCDDIDQLDRVQDATAMTVVQWEHFPLANLFAWSGQALRQLYLGRYDDAWDGYQSIKAKLHKMPFVSIQLPRMLQKQLGTVIALHQLNRRYAERYVVRANLLIDELRSEETPYALVLANFYAGLLTQRISQVRQSTAGSLQAISLLATARDQAKEQQLTPFELAAIDALHCVETGLPSDQLIAKMNSEGVAQPAFFQRLFTIDFSR
jgi:serine/threonine protein kinase